MHSFISHARSFSPPPADPHRQAQQPGDGPAAQALFITCSDSRITPALLTGAAPGELLELRTAGHIVPRYRADAQCGIGGTLEFALGSLRVTDVILCGHTRCTTVRALTNDQIDPRLPLTRNWLNLAAHHPHTRDTGEATGADRTRAVEQRHLLAQLHHLRTYPCVTRRIATRKLRVHTWYYDDDTSAILNWDPAARTFRPL
ncbi:carbonic anhydrase [Streptomyces sp. NPDC058279]|uniref:carbonic anhydrase n=1 Tax=Streptomyces sp. NPDC058279 TaxID=3346418 RepID=UPI0036E7A75A